MYLHAYLCNVQNLYEAQENVSRSGYPVLNTKITSHLLDMQPNLTLQSHKAKNNETEFTSLIVRYYVHLHCIM